MWRAKNITVWLLMGVSFLQLARWRHYVLPASVAQISAIFSSRPGDYELELGSICNTLKSYSCSVQYFKKVVRRDPLHQKAMANLAMSLAKLERFEEGRPYFESYFANGGQGADVFLSYARTMAVLQGVHEGVRWSYAALQVDWHRDDVSNQLVDFLVQEKRFSEALSVIGFLTSGEVNSRDHWRNRWFDLTERWSKSKEAGDLRWFGSDNENHSWAAVRLHDGGLWHPVILDPDAVESTIPSVMLEADERLIPHDDNERSLSSKTPDMKTLEVSFSPDLKIPVQFKVCESCPAVVSARNLKGFKMKAVQNHGLRFFALRPDSAPSYTILDATPEYESEEGDDDGGSASPGYQFDSDTVYSGD